MVSFECVLGVIRSGPEFKTHGDPYDFSCVVTFQGNKAYIRAAVGNFNKKVYREIKELLESMNITEVEWDKLNIKKRSFKKEIGR